MLVFIVHALPLSRRTFLLWIWTFRTRSCAMFSMFRMLHETFPLALSVVPCVDISWTPGMICCRRRPAGRKENFSSISPSRSARPSILCVYLFSQISLALSVFCSAWGVSKYWNKNFTDHVNSDESWARYQTRLFFYFALTSSLSLRREDRVSDGAENVYIFAAHRMIYAAED